jgi:3-methyladenine DNA glycosylase AlkD
MSAPTLAALRSELVKLADPADAVHLQRFFKTGAGEYGTGDRFRGIRVPALRSLERKYRAVSVSDTLKLLRSPWHEDRLLALVMLVAAYSRGDGVVRERIYTAYLANTRYINNWDLVDSSAAQIVGAHLPPGNLKVLKALARAKDLWERRIAIIATLHYIRQKEFAPTLAIARLLLTDSHDLIHKAVGWMLREVGNRDRAVEDEFLREHCREMPRTMLRYAIEKYPEPLRKRYLAGDV